MSEAVPFYSLPERITALLEASAKCKGTPFAPKQMAPGFGLDCVRNPAWCYLQSGFFTKFTPPNYAMDSGSHSAKSYLIDWFEKWEEVHANGLRHFFVRVDSPRVGDAVCLQMPKTLSAHHCGLMISDSQVSHAIFFGEKRVVISDLGKEDFYGRRLRAVFRPMQTVATGGYASPKDVIVGGAR